MGALTLAAGILRSDAAIEITEYMYSGADGEFIEFTNTGFTSVDMTGWSFDDDSGIAGTFSLSGFGLVGARPRIATLGPR